MSTSPRTEPDVPDHEVLRKIGGGAYGEVWMARGITGAYRAVKIVRREDFEDERGFEREFEGILKFEPISRDHPGLVNILHVGRSPDGESFYYYVMELGDDIHNGREISPVEYEARTLRTDIKRAKGLAQATGPCIDAGIRLAEALEHLHELGLAHRDVKPANVIFVNGKAKLADIGLVADRGQRTFVGTEGFVPPEGPGSAQADVYSLGKVLYEIATGKDRLQFPEVPDELHPDTDPKQWHNLNQIICDICEPKISKRTITSAGELATALKRLQSGKRGIALIAGNTMLSAALWVLLVGFTGFAIYLAIPYLTSQPVVNRPDSPNVGSGPDGGNQVPEERVCIVNFDVDPWEGVEVYDKEGNWIGGLSEINKEYEVGEVLEFVFRKEEYDDLKVEYVVPDEPTDYPRYFLKMDRPPLISKRWWDSIEQLYEPVGPVHESNLVLATSWETYLEESFSSSPEMEEIDHKFNTKVTDKIVLVNRDSAHNFAWWLTERAKEGGRLHDDQEVIALVQDKFKSQFYTKEHRQSEIFPLRLKVQKVPRSRLVLLTKPEGASVYLDGKYVGRTALDLDKIRPGLRKVLIEMDGFQSIEKQFKFEHNKSIQPKPFILKKNGSLVRARDWTNRLGMEFRKINETLMAGVWETRVKDYNVFAEEVGKNLPKEVSMIKPNSPIVNVSYNDAVEFAEWLTKRDIEAGLIPENASYRIPTDAEWSLLIGLQEDPDLIIEQKALNNREVYPWVGRWFPEEGDVLAPFPEGAEPVGNFSDESRKNIEGPSTKYYEGYFDGYDGIAPVGSYRPNKLGIFDMAGNVSEWVSDTVNKGRLRVARGSNFKTFRNSELRSSLRYYRSAVPHDWIGFRLVIEVPAKDNIFGNNNSASASRGKYLW